MYLTRYVATEVARLGNFFAISSMDERQSTKLEYAGSIPALQAKQKRKDYFSVS